MVIVGLLLLIIGVVVLMDMGLSSSGPTDVHVLGWHLGVMGPGRVLLLGAAIGVVLTLGLLSILSGQRRSRRRRKDRDRTIAGTRAENKRLASQLEEEKARTAEATPYPVEQPAATAGIDEVDAQPTDQRPGDADYLLGAKYPQETAATSTPPAPPTGH